MATKKPAAKKAAPAKAAQAEQADQAPDGAGTRNPDPEPDAPPPAAAEANRAIGGAYGPLVFNEQNQDPAPADAVPCYLHRIEDARALPEVVGDVDTLPIAFAPGSIRRFKASEEDRRTMEVIALVGGGLAVRAVKED